jgi:hypothetical protein
VSRPTTILSDEALAAIRRASRTRKKKASAGTRIVTSFITSIVVDFMSGFWLMLLVPYAHQHLGTPDRHPGWWPCVVIMALASTAAASFRPVRPKGDDL